MEEWRDEIFEFSLNFCLLLLWSRFFNICLVAFVYFNRTNNFFSSFLRFRLLHSVRLIRTSFFFLFVIKWRRLKSVQKENWKCSFRTHAWMISGKHFIFAASSLVIMTKSRCKFEFLNFFFANFSISTRTNTNKTAKVIAKC